MSIGSIKTSTVSAATLDTARFGAGMKAEGGKNAAAPTIADHVAAADERGPIRSQSTTQGTLLDTYL